MIKSSELRIGNYVEFILKETSTLKTVCLFDLENISKNMTGNYKPIPLTEEWLLKLEFDIEEEWYVSVLGYDFGEIKIYPSPNGFFFIEGVIEQHIGYVHSLQNLYFALTGQELEINS